MSPALDDGIGLLGALRVRGGREDGRRGGSRGHGDALPPVTDHGHLRGSLLDEGVEPLQVGAADAGAGDEGDRKSVV